MVMDSIAVSSQGHKPHAVCIPFPAQGHLNPMLQLAKLLHSQGFHITFVNTEHNHNRLMQASGLTTTEAGSATFQFETIPDGLPPTDADSTQDLVLLTASLEQQCLIPFKELIARLNKAADVPPVSCIVSDAVMLFTFEAAQELGIPEVLLWTASPCGLLGYIQSQKLLEHGIIPFKDANFTKNGDLDKVLDWTIPSMQGIRVKDLPSTIRTTDPNDFVLNFIIRVIQNCKRAPAIMINSFDALDDDVLQSIIASDFPPLYTIGPLQLLDSSIDSIDEQTKSMSTNLWKEDTLCLKWLDSYDSNSVVYVNFGSITVLTNDQLVEFAWGLANSNHPFLWITRPNLVVGESTALPPEFLAVTKERGLITNWCGQKQVLGHPAIGGFLTHCGWNSTLESISNGVPMICWPFFADQQTNCWICCNKWGVGLEIDENVKRDEVEKQVRELMEGEKGKEVKRKAMELRELAHEAIGAPKGSSYKNFEKVIKMLGSTSKQAS